MPVEIVHLSNVVKRPLVDGAGDRLGRVQDVVVRMGDHPHPPIVGLVVAIGGRDLFVPIDKIAGFGSREVLLEGKRVDLRRFERRPGELLLARDLMSHHLINVVGGRLIRANEIEIAHINGTWEVVGVDPSGRGLLQRLFSRRVDHGTRRHAIVDWASIEPFVAHVPSARLRIPYRKLARLHPAQIADLVEAASHEEGEEIIKAVGADRQLEADVFEELDTEHQVEFLRSRPDEEAARLLSDMAPDDAVDLLLELDQGRRLPILQRMPGPSQQKLRGLLNYHPETAGGLMSPDFVSVTSTSAVVDALEAVRASTAPAEAAGVVLVTDEEGRLEGTALIVDLLRAHPSDSVMTASRLKPVCLPPEADVHEVVRKMTDFNLAVAPVVGADGKPLGLITVDDVLELLLPSGWRRQYGMASAE